MKYIWDFICGVAIIGVVPWIIAFITGMADESLHSFQLVDTIVICLGFILAAAAFIAGVAYRWEKRLLPKVFLLLEITVGVIVPILWAMSLPASQHHG